METFKSLVEAVQENNKINNAKWSDWTSAQHIQEVYGELENDYRGTAELFLGALIRDGGENLSTYLDAIDCLVYGYAFAR